MKPKHWIFIYGITKARLHKGLSYKETHYPNLSIVYLLCICNSLYDLTLFKPLNNYTSIYRVDAQKVIFVIRKLINSWKI